MNRIDDLRAAFLKRLTQDSETKDARRRDFNQAIFMTDERGIFDGKAVWDDTTLDMVMGAFDRAVKDLARMPEDAR